MKENSLISHSLKWGLIIGGINVFITLLMYVIDVSLMTSIPMSGLLFIINISLVVYAGILYRKSIGGYADFKTMLLAVFLLFLIRLTGRGSSGGVSHDSDHAADADSDGRGTAGFP